MLQTLDEMLFANLDVTSHVLGALVYHLARSISVQEKLRQEILRHEGNLNQYSMRQDTYLRCCVLESMRLAPISGKSITHTRKPYLTQQAFTMPELSPLPKVFSGHFIPAKVRKPPDFPLALLT